MLVLAQFLFRMSFGLALGMAITSPKQVTSGYYRNHLYVLLGFGVLATLIALSAPKEFSLWPPLSVSLLAYVGSVCWLYEKPRPGIAVLWMISALSLVGGWMATDVSASATLPARVVQWLDVPVSGLVLGITMAAMLLGHWYLNAPGMALAPLKKLVLLMGAALAVQGVLSAVHLYLQVQEGQSFGTFDLVMIAVRWLFGIILAGVATVMTWQTLKIPNTQAATGLLYVAVIATYLGELVAML